MPPCGYSDDLAEFCLFPTNRVRCGHSMHSYTGERGLFSKVSLRISSIVHDFLKPAK